MSDRAAEIWRRTLAQIPSLFGRLAYMASLREGADGRYAHAALDRIAGREKAERILRHSHAEVFHEWLCLGLEQQAGDLRRYLEAGPPGAALDQWLQQAPHAGFVPPEAREVERELFLTDLAALAQLPCHAGGGAVRHPRA